MPPFKRVVAAVLLSFTASAIIAADPAPARPPRLTTPEKRAVANCLAIVRNCQLPDGAFVQVNMGDAPATPVWVAPYFVNWAVLGLLAEHRHSKNESDLKAVESWLAWCAEHQSPDGYWTDFEGTRESYASNGKVDAWDSSCSLYLLVLEMFRSQGGVVSPRMIEAAKRALDGIHSVTDEADGLTWAKPDYKVKFFLDNIETAAGLRAAAALFKANKMLDESTAAEEQFRRIVDKLPAYWVETERRYAWALHPNGKMDSGLAKIYPHALAQLFGIVFVKAEKDPWNELKKKFRPETEAHAAAGVERWLSAASRIDAAEWKKWRAAAAAQGAAFQPQGVYIFRPGILAATLLEGADGLFPCLIDDADPAE